MGVKRKKSREEILSSRYASLTELGILLGKTSHEIGRMLKILGLWEPNFGPTQKAFRGGYIWNRPYEKCPYRLNTWDLEKTMAALAAAGLSPVMMRKETVAMTDRARCASSRRDERVELCI